MPWYHVISADGHDTGVFATAVGVSRSTTFKRTGAYSFRVASSGVTDGQAILNVPFGPTYYFGFAARNYATGDITSRSYIDFRDIATVHIRLQYHDTTNEITVYRGAGTTYLGTIPGVLANELTFLDCRITIDDSAGVVTIRDSAGVVLFHFEGDTRNGAGAGITNVKFWADGVAGWTSTFFVDDIAIRDDGWVGPGGNHVLLVTGDGDNTNWDASAGDDWQCVDELPPTFADYIYADASISGTRENVVTDGVPMDLDVVDVVAVYAKAKLSSAGSAQLKATLKSGSAYAEGSAVTVDTGETWVGVCADQNPNTSTAWTNSTASAAQPGVVTV